jgi:polysaccharide export outer membrane protein
MVRAATTRAKMKNLFVVSAVISALLIVSSCATMKKDSAQNNTVKYNAQDYILGPDDAVRLTVERHPEWSGEFTIRPDGKITIVGIGEVKLSGLTKPGAEVACTSALEKFINNPQVTIDTVRYASEMIYVLGEVNLPGRYSTGGKKITLRDAIILAALPTHFAATHRVYVITTSENRPAQQVVDLYRILYKGETLNNIAVKPGDVVYVPKTIWGHISTFISDLTSPLQAVPTARQAVTSTPVQ